MKKIFVIALSSLVSFSAGAYPDGTFTCKHKNPKLPDNVYKIQTVSVGGISVPYVEATLYYLSTPLNDNSVVMDSHLKGFADVVTTSKTNDNLQLAALNLSFDGDTFLSCRP